jgi:hypothetical protein
VSAPSSALQVAALVMRLGPELGRAIVALVRAVIGEDEVEARRAYEAARRAAFVARQK